MASPSCPMTGRPPQRFSRQPSPTAAPGAAKSGIAAPAVCMAATDAWLTTRLPSAVTPPSRCRRVKVSRSPAVELIRPPRQGNGPGEGERADQPLAQRLVPALPVEDLDDQAEHHETAVAVGVGRARGEYRRASASRPR